MASSLYAEYQKYMRDEHSEMPHQHLSPPDIRIEISETLLASSSSSGDKTQVPVGGQIIPGWHTVSADETSHISEQHNDVAVGGQIISGLHTVSADETSHMTEQHNDVPLGGEIIPGSHTVLVDEMSDAVGGEIIPGSHTVSVDEISHMTEQQIDEIRIEISEPLQQLQQFMPSSSSSGDKTQVPVGGQIIPGWHTVSADETSNVTEQHNNVPLGGEIVPGSHTVSVDEKSDAVGGEIIPGSHTVLVDEISHMTEQQIDALFQEECVFFRNAVLNCQWDKAKSMCTEGSQFAKVCITERKETALHLAVMTDSPEVFMSALLAVMSKEDVALRTIDHHTALSLSVTLDRINVAKLLVRKCKELLLLDDGNEDLPVHAAAKLGRRKMLEYLLNKTRKYVENETIFFENHGAKLVKYMIISGFVDLALVEVEKHPDIANPGSDFTSILDNLAIKPELFLSGSDLTFWQRQIYKFVSSVETKRICFIPIEDSSSPKFWQIFAKLGSSIKHVKEEKLMHQTSVKLLKIMTKTIAQLDNHNIATVLQIFFLSAANLGIHEVVEEIINEIPINANDFSSKIYLFKNAITERRENVVNLLYKKGVHYPQLEEYMDDKNNNIVHLVAQLAPQRELDRISGAALQIQREMQWFKKKMIKPCYRNSKNIDQKTPKQVFFNEHKELIAEGEKWMKSTATSCSVVAALIATVVFAAAITVPGANDDKNGYPRFARKISFIVFAVADSFSLLFSVGSIVTFTSIQTARYTAEDFLEDLPNRLMRGLTFLTLCIGTMMIAFVCSIILVFHIRHLYFVIPVSFLGCLPTLLFLKSQFPVLWDMYRSKHHPTIRFQEAK